MKRTFLILSLACALACPLETGAATRSHAKKPTPVKVEPEKPKQPVVVLPEQFQNQPVVVAESEEYKMLLSQNQELQAQVSKEKEGFKWYENEVNAALQAKEAEAQRVAMELAKEKQKAKKSGFFAKLFGFTSLLFPLGAIGLVLLCVFQPQIGIALVRIFFNIIKFIASLFGKTLSNIATATAPKPPVV